MPNTQRLVDLLVSSRFFEALDYYEKHETEINEEDSIAGKMFYNAFRNITLDEYDASVPYFNEIFSSAFDDVVLFVMQSNMLDFSIHFQKYENAAYLSDKLVEALENNDSIVSEEEKPHSIKHYAQLKDICYMLQQEDKMKVVFKDSSIVAVGFDQSYNVPVIQVEANGCQTRSLFDTGVSFPLAISRQMADSIGIRVISEEAIIVNNISTPAAYGILDSLKIGNLTIYNILTTIWDMDKLNHLEHSSDMFKLFNTDVTIGLPIMKQMGTVAIDFVNEKLILSEKGATAKDNYNMLIYGGNLYLRAAINSVPHTGFIDTGDSHSEIFIHNKLYNEHKQDFGIVETSYSDSTLFINYKDKMELGIVKKLEWSMPNQFPVVNIKEQSRIRLDTNNEGNPYDATYGFKFLQRFEKVVFDFNKMELNCYYDSLVDTEKRGIATSLKRMNDGRFFEAFDYLEKNESIFEKYNRINEMNYLKAENYYAFNKPDKAIEYYERFLQNCTKPDSLSPMMDIISNYYLLQDYSKVYEKAYDFKNKIYLSTDSVEKKVEVEEYLQNIMDFSQSMCNEAKLKVVQTKQKPQSKLLKESSTISFYSYCNNIPLETQLHPFVNQWFIIKKSAASKVGIREITIPKLNRIKSDIKIHSSYGILDSVSLGNLKLYNVPVLLCDSLPIPADESEYDNTEVLMCLSAMKLSDKLTIDLKENNISFNSKNVHNYKHFNMISFISSVFVRLNFDNQDITGYLDQTSSNKLGINKLFFDKLENKEDINIFIDNLKLADNNQIEVLEKDVNESHIDVFFGLKYLMKFDKVEFDFRNMRLNIEKGDNDKREK